MSSRASDLLSQAVRHASVSLTLGVFVGSAVTSGVAFGVTAAWLANKHVLRKLFANAAEALSAAHLLPPVAHNTNDTATAAPAADFEAKPLSAFSDERLVWAHENGPPGDSTGGSWSVEDGGHVLKIVPTPGLDYWCRTFYTPILVKHDGQSLLAPVAPHAEASLTTAFTLIPAAQFDQAGIMCLIDERTWVKAGIEFVDGRPRLACVVTNDGFSDWSTTDWPDWDAAAGRVSARVRLSKLLPGEQQGGCLVFEAAPMVSSHQSDQTVVWSQVRIASIRPAAGVAASGGRPWRMGVYAASPITQSGCSARFHHIALGPKVRPVHEAALPEGHGGLKSI